MKNQELARTTPPDPVSFASVEAVVSLLGSMASLQHLLAALYARGEGVASEDGYIGSRSQDEKKPAEDNPSAG